MNLESCLTQTVQNQNATKEAVSREIDDLKKAFIHFRKLTESVDSNTNIYFSERNNKTKRVS